METHPRRAETRVELGSADAAAVRNDSRAPAAASESAQRGPQGPVTRALDIPGFDAAIVSFPSGDASREPILVAAHGAGDNPVWQCETWREILGDRGIILCLSGPREMPRNDARYFPDHFALEKMAFASLEALRGALPESSQTRRVVYAGYSQGATMGALMIVTHGDACPRLVLVEGGFDGWTLVRAENFRRSGGERVLFACGTGHCRKRAEASAQTLVKAGVDARVVADLSGGHNYGGAVAHAVKESFAWLVEGDADWNPNPKAPVLKNDPKAPVAPASRVP
jgi:predicted esterase